MELFDPAHCSGPPGALHGPHSVCCWLQVGLRNLGCSAGTMLSNITLGIFGLGMFLPLLYMYAFGFGKPHRERLWAIKLHGIGVMVLLAEVRWSWKRLPH